MYAGHPWEKPKGQPDLRGPAPFFPKGRYNENRDRDAGFKQTFSFLLLKVVFNGSTTETEVDKHPRVTSKNGL